MKEQNHSLKKQGIILFLSQVVAFIIQYSTSFVLVRLINKHDFGVFQQFNLLLTTVLPILGFTLVSSLYFFYPVADAEGKKKYIFQTYVLLFLISVILLLLIWFFKTPFLSLLKFRDLDTIEPWWFFSLGFMLLSSISENLFILEKNNLGTALFFPIEKLIYFSLIVLLTYYTKSYNGAVIGYFIYSATKLIFITYYLFAQSLSKFSLRLDFQTVKLQIAYCTPFLFGNIIFVFSGKFDKLMINQYISPEKFAIYSIAFTSIPLLSNMFSSINNVTIPKLSEYYAKKEYHNVINLYNKLVFTTSSVAIPAVVYFFIMSEEIITLLFTEKYIEATLYYRIYLVIFFFTMTSYGLILRAAKETKRIFWSNTFAGILTFVLGIILIPPYNMFGAIITASAALVFPAVFQLIAEMHLLKAKVTSFFPVKKIMQLTLISLISGVLLLLIKFFYLPVFFSLLISATIYFSLIILLEFFLDLTPFASNISSLISSLNKK